MKIGRDDIQGFEVDERTELLINRYLDGALSDADQAELHVILGRDAAARAMFDHYIHNDALATQALRRCIESTMPRSLPRQRRGWPLVIAASGLAAAAVFVFSIAPRLKYMPAGPDNVVRNGQEVNFAPQDDFVFEPPVIKEVPARLVDYRDDDLTPKQRQQMTDRELIGVRGDDGRFYIIERNVKSTRVAPMAGEY